MSDGYQLQFTQPALDDIDEVPFSLRDDLDRALDRLAASPTSASVRSAFPHPPDRQLSLFTARDFVGKLWYFTTHFRYGQDEQTLFVLRVVAHEPAD